MSLLIGAAALTINVAMQLPYLFNNPDSIDAGHGSKTAMALIPINVLSFDPFDMFWWWDNMTHLLWGITFGAVFMHIDMSYWQGLLLFLLLCLIWEVYEYWGKERPWHVDENGDRLWTFDHAMEDTVLDTYMGVTGLYIIYLI